MVWDGVVQYCTQMHYTPSGNNAIDSKPLVPTQYIKNVHAAHMEKQHCHCGSMDHVLIWNLARKVTKCFFSIIWYFFFTFNDASIYLPLLISWFHSNSWLFCNILSLSTKSSIYNSPTVTEAEQHHLISNTLFNIFKKSKDYIMLFY